MNVAVIGGGLTGLTAASVLACAGHTVAVFEKDTVPGGLASGFRAKNWKWHLEGSYHHLFTGDRHILDLLRRLNHADDIIIKRPVTSSLWNGHAYQLDSPLHLLRFPGLRLSDKLRTGALLGFLKVFPFWRLLEGITAQRMLVTIGGKRAWKALWEPLLVGKFGTFADTISASWFWARIVKRTPSLAYIRGGFNTLVEALCTDITSRGGVIYTDTPVTAIRREKGSSFAVTSNRVTYTADSILLTAPSKISLGLVPRLGAVPAYAALRTIRHLFAQTLILETDTPILRDVYWLNITDRSFPFIAAVAHTNYMDPSAYGGRHITYFGNYLPPGHRYLSMTKTQLLAEFLPSIRKLCPTIQAKRKTMDIHMFVAPFAQPVHTKHYSQKIPPIQTPVPGVYMANMDFVVPWDRGTNYAVELGERAAHSMLESF